MKALITILFIFYATFSFSQITFQKTYGGTGFETALSSQQTNDSGFIISGVANNFGAGAGDAYLLKMDKDGVLQWTKTFGGTGYENAPFVQQTDDGGFIIAGEAFSFTGSSDAYLVKTAMDGSLQWSRTFGGWAGDRGLCVRQTEDGGFIFTGFFSLGFGLSDIYLVKTDSDGSLQWAKTFGGSGGNLGYSVEQSTDGGFIVCGYTTGFGAGNPDIYLVKTASDGSLQWSRTFGGTSNDQGYFVQQTRDGGFIVTGMTNSYGSGNLDLCLIKIDSTGNLSWSKTFGGIDADFGESVQETKDGGFIVTGGTMSFGAGGDACLIRTDSIGKLMWSKSFGGTSFDAGVSVSETADEGFIISAQTQSFGAGADDVYLIKTDKNGNSGCNEGNPNTITTIPAMITTNPPTQVSSGGISGNPPTQTGSGGMETMLCLAVGMVEDSISNSPFISPNPVTSSLRLAIANWQGEKMRMEIFDVLGNSILKSEIHKAQEEINVSDLPSGVYYLKIHSEGKSAVKKFVKM